MSQENVALVQQGIAAINEAYATDDIAPWREQVQSFADAELVLEAGADAFTEGDWHGHQGAIEFVANQMEVLQGMWIRLDEFIHVAEDRFVVAITFGGQARHTAIPVELHPFHALTLRAGKVLRWQVFLSREEALSALGPSK